MEPDAGDGGSQTGQELGVVMWLVYSPTVNEQCMAPDAGDRGSQTGQELGMVFGLYTPQLGSETEMYAGDDQTG